ncbi:MAG: ABC transporter ATP-binding protein [Erysipelotrichaceae bacterium]|nr:ABC transporter ATP-binding protein [Erysipelotrichaceae bacterium]
MSRYKDRLFFVKIVLMEKVISFKDLSFQYSAQKQPTLKHIDLDIHKGEKILICGPSGSGKSTVGSCINGLIPFSYEGKMEGSLKVADIETKDASIFRLSAHVGTVLQDSDAQFIGLTVAEDIAFSLENDCVSQEDMYDIAKETAEEVGIGKQLDHAPGELSGGQKQRVSLAGVMVSKAGILLFDEPLANLDPRTGKSAIELIDRIQKETGATCIIIEHRLEDVLWRHVDRVVLIDDGEIKADLDVNSLLSTDTLNTYGIREPLYITCAKYAGVGISPEKKPEHIDSFLLDERDRKLITRWFHETVIEKRGRSEETALRAEDISFTYPQNRDETLHHISFEIKKGEMVSIVGQNGAGKSTLAKLICGFETISKGKLYLNGEDITGTTIRSRAKYIGYVMQDPNQMISQSMIFDEVALGLRYLNLNEDEIKERVYKILKVCGLYEFRNWPINALSYGQKKRVTIASVLVMGPQIIILDEPTAGQDFRHYTEIMEFLRTINREGITVIIISHDMHLMLEYTERSLVIVDGEMIADKTPSAVLCDRELVERASLKETSLFELALKCGIDDPVAFTDCFISYDRKMRENGR